jgi:transmembrane E3 ubiquitin-protein ligase
VEDSEETSIAVASNTESDIEASRDPMSQERNTSAELGIASVPTLNKRYMKTPCGHNYHIVCLTKWMDIRLECPTCRQRIPQIEDD